MKKIIIALFTSMWLINTMATDALNTEQYTRIIPGSGIEATFTNINNAPVYYVNLNTAVPLSNSITYGVAATFDVEISGFYNANFNIDNVNHKTMFMPRAGGTKIMNLCITDSSISDISVEDITEYGTANQASAFRMTLASGLDMRNYVVFTQRLLMVVDSEGESYYTKYNYADEILIHEFTDASQANMFAITFPSGTSGMTIRLHVLIYRLQL